MGRAWAVEGAAAAAGDDTEYRAVAVEKFIDTVTVIISAIVDETIFDVIVFAGVVLIFAVVIVGNIVH